jgi:hypothetical protein
MLPYLTTRRLTLAAAAALALAGAACKDPTSVPELNNIPESLVTGNLDRNSAQLLTQGMLNRDRDVAGFRYIVFAGTLARDVYNIDPSENRFQTELLGNAIDPAGFTGGSGGFTEAFNAIATADLLINKIGTAADLTAAQQAGVRGVAYTFKALDLYRALELRGTNGIPVRNVAPGTSGTELQQQSPIRCEPAALAVISATLDSGATALAAAGASFAITLPGGFSSNGTFNTPAGFLRFNRGLKGRVELYRGLRGGGAANFTKAIQVLTDSSFLDVNAPLTNGVYFTYAGAPDVFNPVAVPTVFLNPTVTTAATGAGAFGQSQVLQAGDLRGAAKVEVRPTTTTRNGVSTNLRSPIATATSGNLSRPIPILRNAELILLRAQAEIELGQFQAATADINVVRTREGGLAPIPTIANRTEGIQRVLYEKRFSLLLEGAQRLVDLRTYGLLNAANLGASQRSADTFNTQLPIPQSELDQRQQTAAQAVCTP